MIADDPKFWAKVDKSGECWIWTGHVNKEWGYGMVRRKGRPRLTHRWAWELTNGEIPAGLMVCHHCDVPACVNPTHLFLGTHQDNMDDMIRKCRARHDAPAVGSANGAAKLTEKDIPQIRRLIFYGLSNAEIGRAFSVGLSNISAIRVGKTWKHVA